LWNRREPPHARSLRQNLRHGTQRGSRRFASANISLVLPGELPEAIPFDPKTFDLIALLDVLEHLDDDAATLSALRQFLKPSGNMLITVPVHRVIWSPHDIVHQHKRRYSLRELKARVRDAGLTVTFGSYFNTFLFPIISIVRVFGRISRNQSEGGDLKMPSRVLNRLLYSIFASERFLIGRYTLPFGVSAMVIAENK
jgi:SAM-dependent methyltransferase